MSFATIIRRLRYEAGEDADCDMKLPSGHTCGDCHHWPRCSALICDLDPSNRYCDFAPHRFVERKDKPK